MEGLKSQAVSSPRLFDASEASAVKANRRGLTRTRTASGSEEPSPTLSNLGPSRPGVPSDARRRRGQRRHRPSPSQRRSTLSTPGGRTRRGRDGDWSPERPGVGAPNSGAREIRRGIGNDPSAGSPMETLLRLLLPLNDHAWALFRQTYLSDRPEERLPGRCQSRYLAKSFDR